MNNDNSVCTNKDNLRLALKLTCEYHDGFNICHLNARSLTVDKLEYLNYIFHNLKIDVICVTETWFKPDIENSVYALCDFAMVRNDRSTGCRGGGIGIYYKASFNCRVLHKSSRADTVESVFVEFSDNTQKCLVVCVYNPQKRNDLTFLFTKINEMSLSYVNVLICGDFNVDILINNTRSKNLLNNFNDSGITVANKYATRFAPHCKPSMLDLIGVSIINNVKHTDQFPLSGVSDHELLFLCYNIQFCKIKSKTNITYRDFKNVNTTALFNESSSLDWNFCWLLSSVDDKLAHFTMLVKYLFDKYVIIRSLKMLDN